MENIIFLVLLLLLPSPCLPLSSPQVRVDHRNGTLHFGAQQLESDKIRNHISLLARRLSKAVTMIEPAAVPAAVAAQKQAALALCREHVAKEHSRLLARKQVGVRGRVGAVVLRLAPTSRPVRCAVR